MNTKKVSKIVFYAVLIVFVGLLLVILGCNSAPLNPRAFSNYLVHGVLVSDANRDSTRVAVNVLADDEQVASATVKLNNDALTFSTILFGLDSLYWRIVGNTTAYKNATYPVAVADAGQSGVTSNQLVADTFSILDIIPPTRLSNGNDQVRLTWDAANNAQTYVMAAVRKNNAYQGTGYSQYVTSMATAATINPDAFYLTDGINPDTGWYYLYVYALTGSPDSTISNRLLPVPLPSQLGNNISSMNLEGNFGALIITKRDSVRIATQP